MMAARVHPKTTNNSRCSAFLSFVLFEKLEVFFNKKDICCLLNGSVFCLCIIVFLVGSNSISHHCLDLRVSVIAGAGVQLCYKGY
jgi:Na+/melibiose symporter-like transporter